MIPKILTHKKLTQQNRNFILLTDMSQAPPGTLIWWVMTHHYKNILLISYCHHLHPCSFFHYEPHTQNSSWSFRPTISYNSILYFYNVPVHHHYWVLVIKRIKLYNNLNKSTFMPNNVSPHFFFFIPTACVLTFQVKVFPPSLFFLFLSLQYQNKHL